MPRMSAAKTVNRPPPPLPRSRARAKKLASQQDRLKARTLFFRRVRRSIRPGLWILGVTITLVMLTEIFHSLPSALPSAMPRAVPVASHTRVMRDGFAALAGYAGFRVRDIDVIGADTTKLPVIQAAIGVRTGDPIFGFSLKAIQASLQQLGPVQSATVERALPGTLIVTITERAAYAIWQNNAAGAAASFVLIDKNGNVIADQDAAAAKRRDPSLLLLVGADAPQNAPVLVSELKAQPSVMARVVAAERVDGLRWNLTLKNQTSVKLPEDNESQAIGQLASLQSSMQLLDRPVEVIDLRLPGRLIIRPYPAAAPPPAAKTAGHAKG